MTTLAGDDRASNALFTTKRTGDGIVDGPEALHLCQNTNQRIDLLLTDSIMPGMSGRELAERLLALRPTLAVLVMSGYSEDRVLEQGLPPNAAFIQNRLRDPS